MLRKNSTTILVATICILSTLGSVAFGQRKVSVTQTFEPAFSIEPLVHRIQGRRGDVLQFQFQVTPKNKEADIEVSLVGLRQEISGQILHDETTVDDGVIQLVNPGRYTILRDQPHIIEGIVRVPSSNAAFHSYGVLVKDFGTRRNAGDQLDEEGQPLTSAGINFITQYVLRIDLEVLGSRGQRAEALMIEDGQLATANGFPGLTTRIRNPTDTAFEFEMRARLKRSPSDRSFKPVRLVMPVRQGVETEERFVARILPGSTIQMQEIVPEPLMDGEYEMEVAMLVSGREVNKKSFSVLANTKDYPAQSAQIASVGGGIYTTPARVELSQVRGGNRRLSMEFKNNSSEARSIMLQPLTADGSPIQGLMLQPSEFTLSPGRNRRLSISLRRTRDFDEAISYGAMAITSRALRGELDTTGSIPIAIQYGDTEAPQLELEPARWVDTGSKPAFRAFVRNTGAVHVPLDSRLVVVSEAGKRFIVSAGYGKWLMPGKSEDLEFRMPGPLPPGKYKITTELQTGTSPIVNRQDFTITDFDNANSISSADQAANEAGSTDEAINATDAATAEALTGTIAAGSVDASSTVEPTAPAGPTIPTAPGQPTATEE